LQGNADGSLKLALGKAASPPSKAPAAPKASVSVAAGSQSAGSSEKDVRKRAQGLLSQGSAVCSLNMALGKATAARPPQKAVTVGVPSPKATAPSAKATVPGLSVEELKKNAQGSLCKGASDGSLTTSLADAKGPSVSAKGPSLSASAVPGATQAPAVAVPKDAAPKAGNVEALSWRAQECLKKGTVDGSLAASLAVPKSASVSISALAAAK